MFQRYDDPEPLPIRRVAQPSALARHRYAILRERQNSSGYLSYALVLLFLFQTLLLACVALFLGALVLFSFIGISFRAQETTQMAIVLTRMAPLVGTPTVAAMLPAPASPLAGPAPVEPTMPPTVAPTPEILATAPPPAPESPLPTPTIAGSLPPPTQPVNNAPLPPADLAAIQTYSNQVIPPIDQLSAAIESLRGFAQNPHLEDPQWSTNVQAQIGIVRNAQSSLQIAQPPQSVVALHNELVNAVNACKAAVDILDTILINRNVADMGTANAYIQSCLATFPQTSGRVRNYIRVATGQ
ncbi:MAG: hypothetical protein NT075_37405 [Chloroflexi bacterium]|nr:hypothetical protein [Chloroflexota bacterium]